MKNWFLIFFCIISNNLLAQDTLWLQQNGTKLTTEHYITNNENIFTLGRIYNLPLAEIANLNNSLYAKGFKNGDAILIPISKVNYITDSTIELRRPLYYKIKNNETLLIIARNLGVRQGLLQSWNNLATPQVKNGQVILAGWIYYKEETQKYSTIERQKPNIEDTTFAANNNAIQSALAAQYDNNLVEALEQGGAIVFYDPNIQLEEGNYYALHATLPRGQVVKVTNPENNESIFVTIIAKLPQVEEYKNAIMAISKNAISTLKANNKRIFCKLHYK